MNHHDDIERPNAWSVSRRRALQLTGGLAAAGTLPATSATAGIRSTEASTTNAQQATLTEGTNLMVAVSPDGKWLAFDLVTAIWVTPAAGGSSKRLTDDLQDATRPRWSPDGRQIVFQSYRDGNFHLWSIRPDGTGLHQLTTGRFDHREPHFTPDGRSLVFSSDRGGNGSYGIHRLDVGTGAIVALTDDPTEEAEPAVSPDGRKIAFTTDTTAIIELDLTTGQRRTAVAAKAGITLFGPAYSPAGQLAYVRLSGPTVDLVIGDTAVTSGKDVFAVPPSWSSAEEIFYTADGKVLKHRVGGAHRRRVHRRSTRDIAATAAEGAGPRLDEAPSGARHRESDGLAGRAVARVPRAQRTVARSNEWPGATTQARCRRLFQLGPGLLAGRQEVALRKRSGRHRRPVAA